MMIVKIGGGSAVNIKAIVEDLATLREPVVIVHGANALRDDLARRLSIEVRQMTSVSGVTSTHSDDEMIDLMLMAYAGCRNKRIVELCQQAGLNAVGLTGLDGRLVEGERNSAIRVRENGKTLIVRDNSGKPKRVNGVLLRLLLDNGFTPVITVPIADTEGRAINADNDDVVAMLHQELAADHILQFIEAPGLLSDRADPQSLISSLPAAELGAWEERVEGRMRRKIMGIRKIFQYGTPKVIIADGRVEHPVTDALSGKGTVVQAASTEERRL